MLRRASVKLGKVKSIEINVNITWLIVFGLLVYWLRTGYVADEAPGLADGIGWVVSAVGALLLFASVLAHELAHSLVALRNGLPIRSITLFIFGGVARMEREPQSPGVELRMALAGPAASVAIGAVFAMLRFLVLRGSVESAAALVTEYATYANLVLAGFNLVPGYPLDGGRILRAILWKATGNLVRSTTIAGMAGRVFGLLLVFAGVVLAVASEAVGFLWLALIGTFLERLAFLSVRRVRIMEGRRQAEASLASGPASMTPYPTYHSDYGDWHGADS